MWLVRCLWLVSQVEIDRRMLDFCVGLDTEFSELVEGSHLYFPKTKFESVSRFLRIISRICSCLFLLPLPFSCSFSLCSSSYLCLCVPFLFTVLSFLILPYILILTLLSVLLRLFSARSRSSLFLIQSVILKHSNAVVVVLVWMMPLHMELVWWCCSMGHLVQARPWWPMPLPTNWRKRCITWAQLHDSTHASWQFILKYIWEYSCQFEVRENQYVGKQNPRGIL